MKSKKIVTLLIVIIFFFCLSSELFHVKSINENNLTTSKLDGLESIDSLQLIDIIIDREIYYIDYFSSKSIGIENFKANNVYYKELIKRENSVSIIYKYLNNYSNEDRDKLLFLANIINSNTIEFVEYDFNNRDNVYAPNGTIIDEAVYSVNTFTYNQIVSRHNAVIFFTLI